jgi:hypothetical protein
MQRSHTLPRLALGLGIALLGLAAPFQPLCAHVPAPSDPGFPVLLQAEPIVVVAKVGGVVGDSKRTFEAIPGDYDSAPAFTEEYRHYQLHAVRPLKGDLPEIFEVRVIAGSRNHILLDRAQDQEMLLILAPDSGLNEQGLPRSTFLITHGAAYAVRNGVFEVRGEQGSETWSVESSVDAIERFRRERERQQAESPEPKDAAVAVFAGEDPPGRREQELPEGPKLRERGALPPDALTKVAPKAIEAPDGDAGPVRPRD